MMSFSACPTVPKNPSADSQHYGQNRESGTAMEKEGSNLFSFFGSGKPFFWPALGIDMNEPVTRSVVNTVIAVAGLIVIAKIVHSIRKRKIKRR